MLPAGIHRVPTVCTALGWGLEDADPKQESWSVQAGHANVLQRRGASTAVSRHRTPSLPPCSARSAAPGGRPSLSPAEAQAGGADAGRGRWTRLQGFLTSFSESTPERLGLPPGIHVQAGAPVTSSCWARAPGAHWLPRLCHLENGQTHPFPREMNCRRVLRASPWSLAALRRNRGPAARSDRR